MDIKTYKMINLDSITNENNTKHNEKWPYIPDHPYTILIIGGSENIFTTIHEKKISLTLNKPIYVRFTVLEISKWEMYNFL